jgi:hypothetical protein
MAESARAVPGTRVAASLLVALGLLLQAFALPAEVGSAASGEVVALAAFCGGPHNPGGNDHAPAPRHHHDHCLICHAKTGPVLLSGPSGFAPPVRLAEVAVAPQTPSAIPLSPPRRPYASRAPPLVG